MQERIVDHSALKTNQAFIIALLVTAFVTNTPWLVAFVALVMLVGTVLPRAQLFKAVYLYVLKPRNLVKPDPRKDNPEPHQFAQLVGGIVLGIATLAFLIGVPVAGWALAWFVTALAALNLFAGICVGCLMYYQFNRLGVPGFRVARVQEKR